MNIVIFLNIPILKKENIYSSYLVNLIDFFLNFASLIKSLKIVTLLKKGKGPVVLNIPNNVSILELPYYCSPFELMKISWKFIISILKILLKKDVRKADVIGIVAPGTIFFFSYPLIRLFCRKKPIFLIVRGDKKKTVEYEYKDNFLKRITAFTVITIYDFLVKMVLRKDKRVIMFTIGGDKKLEKRYGNKKKIYKLIPMIPKSLIKRRILPVKDQNKKFNLLYLGRLSKEKGVDNLLNAFSQVVKEKGNGIVLHLVGSGPEELSLKKKVEELNLKDKVIFRGFIPRSSELWNIVDSSDIFILPSYTEGSPRAIFEVMARGVPVICTKVGGIPQVIKDGLNGLLVEPGNIEDLKNAILKLIENPNLRNQLVKEGYKIVEQVTFEGEGKKMVEIIKSQLLKK